MATATLVLLLILALLILVVHLGSHFIRHRSRRVAAILMCAEAFVVMIFVMLLTNDKVGSDADKLAVQLGWPVRFVEQNQSRFDPPYPYDMSWAWEVPTEFYPLGLALNWAIFLLLILLVNRISIVAFRTKMDVH